MKRTVLLCIVLLGCVLSGCAGGSVVETAAPLSGTPTLPVQTSALSKDMQAAVTLSPALAVQGVAIHNNKYGFDFMLPDSWQGYSVVDSQWVGLAVTGEQAGKIVESGPGLTIRHPLWTTENQRQDIPILVFTLEQWDALGKESFHIGAAPIGPGELGRNSRYVFALPARYNFAYFVGYEEVETILYDQPLKPTEAFEG